jgi:predicted Zn-dependent protease
MNSRRLVPFRLALPALAFLAVTTWMPPAAAETVEVAPGVQVTKRTFPVPANEQPFFGFKVKTEVQREADDKFLKALLEAAGTKEKALDEITRRGWRALGAGKLNEAAQRFNQAFLVAPEQSVVYHGFAAIVQIRFNEVDYAEELFRLAQSQPNPLKILNADYGRLLLIARKPALALPVLEQAVKDMPDFGDAWTNLAWARLHTADRDGACAAAAGAMTRRPSSNASVDLNRLRSEAQCG